MFVLLLFRNLQRITKCSIYFKIMSLLYKSDSMKWLEKWLVEKKDKYSLYNRKYRLWCRATKKSTSKNSIASHTLIIDEKNYVKIILNCLLSLENFNSDLNFSYEPFSSFIIMNKSKNYLTSKYTSASKNFRFTFSKYT